MKLSSDQVRMLRVVDGQLQAAGMNSLSSDEMRVLAEKILGGGQEMPGNPGASAPGSIPGQGQPPMAGGGPMQATGLPGANPALQGGLMSPQQEPGYGLTQPQGLSNMTKGGGKGRIVVDTDEHGKVTKITQTLTPGVGGLSQNGG